MKMLLEKSDEIADRVWKVMDANKDGIITKTEFLAKFQQLMDTGFQMVP